MPQEDVLAIGTTDYPCDAERQHHAPSNPEIPLPGWGLVHGEILSFDDPEYRLPALDALEGFRPGEKSFYERVLIPATLAETNETVLAWAYAVESASGVYLPGGHWPAS